MQLEIIDVLGVLGFIISLSLVCIKYLEYRIESDKHIAILDPSWESLPPEPNKIQKSTICLKNIGERQAVIKEIKVKFSYVDEPQIVANRGYVPPGVTARYIFDYIQPPIGQSEIVATITTERGFIMKKTGTITLNWYYHRKK